MPEDDAVSAAERLYHHPLAADWTDVLFSRFARVAAAAPPESVAGPFLWAAPDHLELRFGPGREAGSWVDAGEVRRRVVQGSDLRRACGIRPGMTVFDAMAGFGLDGVVLAAAGAQVMMAECEPFLQALQEDLLRRLAPEFVLSPIETRLGDGFRLLLASAPFDVVYLDPMFPARNKRALPNKRMQHAAQLAGSSLPPRPLEQWLEAALPRARKRVVVKRRRLDAAAGRPDWQLTGRTVRYDVYLGRAPVPSEGPGS